MNTFEDVQVEFLSGGATLQFYDAVDEPDATLDGGRTRNYYVEATSGAVFSFVVSLKSSYDVSMLRPDDAVRVLACFNSGDQWLYIDLELSHILQRRTGGRRAHATFQSINEYNNVSGKWFAGSLTFSDLVKVDSNDQRIGPDQIKGLGRIQIKIERYRRKDLHKTYCPTKTSCLGNWNEVPEKALKGRAISSALSSSNMREVAQPQHKQYDAWRVVGPAGEPLKYNIYYRSRRDLQAIGCIPRSPTPEPDLREEVRELRARLAVFESNPDSNIKDEANQTARIKRERGEAQIERSRKRSRGPQSEVIDLTDD